MVLRGDQPNVEHLHRLIYHRVSVAETVNLLRILCFYTQQRSFYKKDFASRCNLLVGKNNKNVRRDTGVTSFPLSRSFQSTSLIAVFDFIAQRHDMEMDNPKIRVFAGCPHGYL